MPAIAAINAERLLRVTVVGPSVRRGSFRCRGRTAAKAIRVDCAVHTHS